MQCSDNQKKEIKFFFDKLCIKYELSSFFDNIVAKLYETDVLITRSGAGSVNDVILTKIPTIFVPFPSSTNNHQYYNAYYLNKKNAALLIEQKDLNSEKSIFTVINLIINSNQQINLIKKLQEIKIIDTNQLMFTHLND